MVPFDPLDGFLPQRAGEALREGPDASVGAGPQWDPVALWGEFKMIFLRLHQKTHLYNPY